MNNQLRLDIANYAQAAGGGHIPSCYSCIDIIASIFDQYPIIDSSSFDFVLSKGHAALSLYVVLHKYGLLTSSHLQSLNTNSSILGGHPDASKVPTVLFNTGSLGHGLPCSLGYCYANRHNNYHLFCMLGDGECNEGTIWESAAIASNLAISNITVIVDYNKSTNNVLKFHSLPSVWESFGWRVFDIDGHDSTSIKESLSLSVSDTSQPCCIIANTIKGKGVEFIENNGLWHYRCPSDKELSLISQSLGF
ncbi:hypothetical protein N8478_01390 [bacterium]|nr:hypothetical protein [bacterium]